MNKFNKILRILSISLVLACIVVFAASCDLIGGGQHQHNLTKVDKVDATCTEAGCEAYYTCDGCDKIFKDFGATVELDAPVVIEATGHKIVGILGKEPTCSEAGVENCFKCTECDALFSDLKGENPIDAPATIDPTSHDLVKTEAKAATCTENGSIEFYTCKNCKNIFSDADGKNAISAEDITVNALGHDLTATEAKDATCTEAGNIAYWTCGRCNVVYANAEATEVAGEVVVPAKGHDYSATLVVEGATTAYEPGASFTTDGLTVKKVCACGDAVTVNGYTYDKTGALTPEDTSVVITYVEGDKTYTATISITVVHTHVTGELIAKVEPTCTEEGTIAHYDCTVCKKHFEDAAATKELTDLSIAAKGHSMTKTEAVASSCTVAGNNAYWTCSVCGGVFADELGENATTVNAQKLPLADHDTELVAGDDGHYEDCKNCDYRTESEAHTGFAYPGEVPTCTVCSATIGAEAGWDGWVLFRPGIVEVTNGLVNSASHVNVNGIMASKYVFGAHTAGAESTIWTMSDKHAYKADKYQVRIPTVGSNERYIYLYVSNEGTTSVSFRIFSENYGDKGGVDVTLGAGESGWFKYSVHTGTTVGSNVNLKLLSDLESEAAITMYGYWYLDESEIADLQIANQDQIKLSYKEGEKFDISNLILSTYIYSNANGDLLSDGGAELYYIANNFKVSGLENGQVLQAGSYNVTVSFGGKSVEFTVIVSSHAHSPEYVAKKNATCTVDGHEAYYICNVDGCGQLFADAEGNTPISEITVLKAGHIDSAAIPGFKPVCPRCGLENGEVRDPDGWVHFAPGVVYGDYYEAVSGTVNGKDYIDYELITLENGMNATKFTFAAGTPANAATSGWNDQDLAHNIKVPVRSDGTRTIVVITNHGTEDLTFSFGQVDSSRDMGSGTVLVPAGKTAAVEFTITSGADTGNNFWIAVRNNVVNETSITLYGYFNVEGDVEGLKIKSPANKLVFAAGETFTAEGIRLNMTNSHGGGAYYGQTEIYSNFTTDLDGYTFTAQDEGTKTVTVSFCGKTVTYEIEVTGHKHNLELVPGMDAVKCEKDGYEAYYRCTVVGCGEIFADASAQNKISAPVAISAHGSVTIANGKVVCADCLTFEKGENWVFYNITTNYGAHSVVNGKIEAADIDGIPGSMIYIGAGTVGGQGANFQLCMGDNDANKQTVIPNLGNNHISGELRHVLVFYKNYGTEDVTLNLQNDAQGGNGKITIPAGGTAVSSFDIHNVGGSNWFNLYIDSNVTVDTQIGAYGYIYINDSEVELQGIKKAANKTEFAVGDTFTAEGLVLDVKIPSSNTKWLYASSGYTTSLDGVSFTEAGTYTVEVSFCGKTLTYEITVA